MVYQEKETMLEKHEQELINLKNKYKSKMAVDLHALFDIKQEEDKRSFEFFNNNFLLLCYYQLNF